MFPFITNLSWCQLKRRQQTIFNWGTSDNNHNLQGTYHFQFVTFLMERLLWLLNITVQLGWAFPAEIFVETLRQKFSLVYDFSKSKKKFRKNDKTSGVALQNKHT